MILELNSMEELLIIAHLSYFIQSLTAQTRSRESSLSSSGHSTPRMNVTSLPPGFIGNNNDGNDVTVEGTAIID